MKRVLYISCLCLFSFIQPVYPQYYRWIQISDLDDVYDIKTNTTGDIFFCRQESGGIRRSTNDGETWDFLSIGGANIGNLAINDSGVIFASDRLQVNNSVYRSADNGSTWFQCSLTGGRMSALHISSEQYVYAGNDSGRFFRSLDNGLNWSSVLALDKQINTIGTCSNGQIFIGTYQKGIYTSTDYGTTWSHTSFVDGNISSIVVNDSDYVFAANDDSIFVSKDYGISWLPAGYFMYASSPPLGIDSAGVIYTGHLHVYKSTDNGQNWINMNGPVYETAIEIFGKKVYLAAYGGVYRYDPDYILPSYPGNYVPLEVGNKWEYFGKTETSDESVSYSIDTLEVTADTLISNNQYFKTNEVNDWFRFSEQDQKLYIRWNDSDYVNMDFNVLPDESFQQLTFNTHQLINVTAVRGEHQIFDSTLIYEGYRYLVYHGGHDRFYTAPFGESNYSWAYGSDTPVWMSFDRTVIQAILIDSTGTPHNYTYSGMPFIEFYPFFYSASTMVTFDFYVRHPYTRLPPNQISGGLNFIDSVLILSYYKQGDSIVTNNPVPVPSVYYTHYLKTLLLNDSLFTNGFNFYYKIQAKDKGILPKYDFDPDTGYYQLAYFDTNTVIPIQFLPAADTVILNSATAPPELLCSNMMSINGRDSISIKPGANTSMHYVDSLGNPVYLVNCSFLVTDSLNLFNYELWYHPKSSPPFTPILIKFDSLFDISQTSFDIELRVKFGSIIIESFLHSFKADWTVGINNDDPLPGNYGISQNYPNPFNSSTVIKYQIPELSFVNIKVFDLLGREVTTLVNEEKPAGYYQLDFDASNLSTGIYIYRIKAGSFSTSRKMILLK